MSKTYKDYNITESAIEKAEKVLSDNGVEADEVKTVLQALGYVLLDCEMYPAPIYPSETFDISDWTHILSEQEVADLQAYAAKIHWGFNSQTLKSQIGRFENGDKKEKCKVYFLLEDCNFHEVAGLLAEGKVKEAYEWANTQID